MFYKVIAFVLWMVACTTAKKKLPVNPSANIPSAEDAITPLPSGNNGIASRYPGDIGIGADSSVIFCDDFESYNSVTDLPGKWSDAYHTPNLRIVSGPENIFKGSRGLEFTVPQTSVEVSNTVEKKVSPGHDSLFLRYYAMFDSSFNVLGSSHNGCSISSKLCCPGEPANGSNKFTVSYEAWREDTATKNPGELNVYVYHPDQRSGYGDHFFPSGRVTPFGNLPGNFGPNFIARKDIIPQPGRWYCYELMVKTNTPGKRDGRIAMWLDGKLIADFPNQQLRTTKELMIDKFTVDLHIKYNTLGIARKWIDNVVAATAYIGPLN